MPPEMTMKDHRSLFRQLLSGMYDAVIITDPSGHVLEFNPRAKEFFGYETAEVMDSPVARFIPGVTAGIVERIREGLGANRHMMLDANCIRRDATAFPAEVTVSLIDLLDPGDLVFTIRNVERRRRQIEALRTRENAAEASLAALFACGADGRFRWANGAFLQMFGFESLDEAQKAEFAEVFDDEPFAEAFAAAAKGERPEALRVTAEGDEGEGGGDVEIVLAPDVQGKRQAGVVGSAIRV